MEEADDDEFGDLYTDVLRPSSSPIPPLFSSPNLPKLPLPSSHSTPPPTSPDHPNPCSPIREPEREQSSARVSNAPLSDPAQESEIRVFPDSEKARVLTEEAIGDLDSDPVIPGLSMIDGIATAENGVGVKQKDDGDDDDDWDSDDDSEDDLQIVLNDIGVGPMGAEQNEEEDEDDGEDLVIVADGDQLHPGIEEQEWGEEGAQAAVDGERKEVGEAGKGIGGGVMMGGAGAGAGAAVARIGYSNHGFYPHHSQFKVSFSMKMLDSSQKDDCEFFFVIA